MQLKEFIDKRVIVVSSVTILFMLCMLLALVATNTRETKKVSTSAAQKEEVAFAFGKNSLQKNTDEEVEVDVMLKTKSSNRVSAATVLVKYPVEVLKFSTSDYPSTDCQAKSNKLDTALAINNNSQTGVLEITKTALLADEELPSGNFCFGTLRFEVLSDSYAGKELSFEVKSGETLVVGPKVKYNVKIDSANGKAKLN